MHLRPKLPVLLVMRHIEGPLMIKGVRASSIRIESTSSTIASSVRAGPAPPCAWPCRYRAVIEAELGIRAVGDIAIVLLAPHVWRLVVQDAADGKAKEFVHGAHPFAVTAPVIVDGYHVNTRPESALR